MKSKFNYLATTISIPIFLGAMGAFGDRVGATGGVRVACNADSAIPTITATLSNPQESPSSQDTVSQQTDILSFLPEYFSPEEASLNCEKTAVSLQSYYDRGVMNYLASDTIAGKPAICVVERRGVRCNGYNSEILFSLSQAVNPNQLLYDMLGGDFKDSQVPASRTLSRTYSDLRPSWWPF